MSHFVLQFEVYGGYFAFMALLFLIVATVSIYRQGCLGGNSADISGQTADVTRQNVDIIRHSSNITSTNVSPNVEKEP